MGRKKTRDLGRKKTGDFCEVMSKCKICLWQNSSVESYSEKKVPKCICTVVLLKEILKLCFFVTTFKEYFTTKVILRT
jgi:hypothetical protein